MFSEDKYSPSLGESKIPICVINCRFLYARNDEWDVDWSGLCAKCGNKYIGLMDDISAGNCICVAVSGKN